MLFSIIFNSVGLEVKGENEILEKETRSTHVERKIFKS